MTNRGNIPLNSNINTGNLGLLLAEPSFWEKNSLLYKGVASNITKKEGSGILSTTGKNIYVEGNVIHAGSQSFTAPSDYYTVEDIDSEEIGQEEVAIGDIVAGVNNEYAYIGETHINFNIDTDESTEVWVSTVFHKPYFVAAKRTSTQYEIVCFDTEGETIFSWYDNLSTIQWNSSNAQLFGKDLSASYEGNWYAIGFDDDDVRKRLIFFTDNGTNVSFIRGIGCIGANHVAYGEPIPCVRDYYVLYTNTDVQNVWTPRGSRVLPSNYSGALPNIYALTDFYTILPNGVISCWNGPVTKGFTLPGFNTKLVNEVAAQNSGLGASIDDTNSTQEGLSDWLFKLHKSYFTPGAGTPLQMDQEDSTSAVGGSTIHCPDGGANYLYNADSDSSTGYATEGHRNGVFWIWDYNLATGSYKHREPTVHLESGTYQDMMPSKSGFELYNILGDWTYIYDSMKPASELTDYDGIFPAMRLFFNNSSTRGVYWEYDNTHSKFFSYGLEVATYNKEIVVCRTPLVVRYNAGGAYTAECNVSATGSKTMAQQISDMMTNTQKLCISVLDPCMNAYNRICSSYSTSTWKNTIDRFTVAPSKLQKDNTGTAIHAPYDAWSYLTTQDTDLQLGENKALLKPLKIIGEGKGLEEETFSFGGMGDNSILPALNWSTEAYYGTNFSANAVNYSGLQIGLSVNNTLLFNATDMKNKWHVYEKGNGDVVFTLYVGKKSQTCKVVHNGNILVDKLTDYMFRVNLIGTENLLQESRNGLFEFTESFKSYLQENVANVMTLDLTLGTDTSLPNNILYYATGINSDLTDDSISPSFLVPALTIASYIDPTDTDKYIRATLNNRQPIFKQLLRFPATSNRRERLLRDGVDLYYTSSNETTDCTYKETDKLPATLGSTIESYTGVQSYTADKADTTYWIDSDTVIYPTGMATEVSGVNYQTSTIDLPDNYAVRFYNQNNHTWNIYNQNASVWYGKNIFTIMGSNYYFDGQGVYFLGTEASGSNQQYSENTLIAYAIGMEYLCNAPSEAYFYSPFDRCLYIFTSSNTMQKSTSLERFGDILDSCYCPVNQALYLLFDGVLIVKTQDDMAKFDVTGSKLYTTADGVQVADDEGYVIHHPYKYETIEPLDIETDWIGTTDNLFKYSKAFAVFYSEEPISTTITTDYQTIQDATVKHFKKDIKVNKSDWDNGFVRIPIEPGETTGNAFKLSLSCQDVIGLYSLTNYMSSTTGYNTTVK